MVSFAKDTFAVVDLETTGTQHEEGNHIIQFGCAIIKHRQIVKTYSLLINPQTEIPLAVQNLTHITNEDVAEQPDFSYYAPKIIALLKDTVFVAHNVNFDLPFLNFELEQHGYPPLTNRAVDTVELAKIAFPTMPSYKLTDLTHQLKIKHLNPHKADSDAYGTAVLLLKIIDKLEQLPQATLNTLSSLSSGLVRETGWIFTTIAHNLRQKKRPLAKQYQQVGHIILRKKQMQIGSEKGVQPAFPVQDQAKRALFHGKINYRQPQVKLINRIHQFVENSHQHVLLVEAPNGTGKTFSYLFAYAYQLFTNRKLVIATPTKILQNQIVSQEIPQLLAVSHLDLQAEVVKASSHYLDLDGFYQSLMQKNHPNQVILILQMRILVWLTETTTGDLDELQLTTYHAPLFAQISHPGDARVGSKFAAVDFWNLARQRQEAADILVTNHAYLANHYHDTIWGQNPYLVIDEAHCFAENVIGSRNDSFQFESLWGALTHLRNLLSYADDSLLNQYGRDVQFNFLLAKLDTAISALIKVLNQLQELLNQPAKAVSQQQLANGKLLLSFQAHDLFPVQGEFQVKLTELQRKLEAVRQQTSQVMDKLYHEIDNADQAKEATLNELAVQVDQLDFYITKSYQLSDLLHKNDLLKQEGFIVSLTNPDDPLSANLSWTLLDATPELQEIYQRFDHLTFVSATLTDHGDFNFMIKQLGLGSQPVETYRGTSTFKLAQHLEALAVKDLPAITSSEYDQVLAQILINDLTTKRHVLVLMTNLEKIKALFSEISTSPALREFEILAQGVSGSNKRIVKRFAIAPKAIILGADSFWEGIDFHECPIDLVIAAKLPFESPDQTSVSLRQKQLTQQGVNVFKADTMPRALIRFRQGMGRLIRNEHDRGQFLILDSRIWNKEYGQAFVDALPVKIQKISLKELQKKLDNYD